MRARTGSGSMTATYADGGGAEAPGTHGTFASMATTASASASGTRPRLSGWLNGKQWYARNADVATGSASNSHNVTSAETVAGLRPALDTTTYGCSAARSRCAISWIP